MNDKIYNPDLILKAMERKRLQPIDVAHSARCSLGTVYAAINGKPTIRADKLAAIARVLKIIIPIGAIK